MFRPTGGVSNCEACLYHIPSHLNEIMDFGVAFGVLVQDLAYNRYRIAMDPQTDGFEGLSLLKN
jgi:hypothetical protein